MSENGRKRPNVLVTGTPGTGKTTTCSLLCDATGFRHINVGELVKQKNLHDGWDAEFECHIINEDLKLKNNIECEIFQTLLEEAHESYAEDIIVALKSDSVEDLSRNVSTLDEWIKNWVPRSRARSSIGVGGV
ncbi:hypothetical protein AMTRI_Chr04g250830 [Amborella trichopoda]